MDTLCSMGSETMQRTQESKSIVRMLFHRRTLSRATITAFTILVLLVVMCQGRAADIEIPLKNETVTLGENGYFFCRILGTKEQIYFNRMLYSENPHAGTKSGVTVEVQHGNATKDNLRVINVNITIVGSVQHNETLVSCSDHDITASQSSYATFIVQGGPAKPEVSYEVLAEQKEIVLLWPRPFTWEEYPITEYHIMCTDTDVISINNTDNRAVIQHTVELDQDITDCHTLQCNVTACNALDDSIPSVTDISIPLMVEAEQMPTIQLEKHLFTEDKNPEVVFCVKLPVLCSFQNVTYKLIISHEGDQVLELSRQFSYSSGYNSECIEILVTEGLQEGTQYTVQVVMDAGLSGSSYSDTLSFKPELQVSGVSPDNKEFFQTQTGIIVAIVIGTVLVILLLVLITIITVSYKKSSSSYSSNAPFKRTTPMVNNPIYNREEHGPFYEQVSPLHLKRLNSTSSHSNLDSPFHRIPSPTLSPSTPTSPHCVTNNVPASPVSTGSNTAFTWPYSAVQPTNAATFDAIEADVENATRLATGQTRVVVPSSTPGEDSYMTMQAVANMNTRGQPQYVIDVHGNKYIEC